MALWPQDFLLHIMAAFSFVQTKKNMPKFSVVGSMPGTQESMMFRRQRLLCSGLLDPQLTPVTATELNSFTDLQLS